MNKQDVALDALKFVKDFLDNLPEEKEIEGELFSAFVVSGYEKGVLVGVVNKAIGKDIEAPVEKGVVFEVGRHYHNRANGKYISIICKHNSIAYGECLIAESSGSTQFQWVLETDYIPEDWEEVSKGECRDAIQRMWAIGGRRGE